MVTIQIIFTAISSTNVKQLWTIQKDVAIVLCLMLKKANAIGRIKLIVLEKRSLLVANLKKKI